MNEGAQLLHLLRRIQRRARRLAALEGAIAGAAVGLAALALGAATWRARGGAIAWGAAALTVGASALVGAVVGGARRLSLARCARWLDATLDRGGAARDRVLSALSFLAAAREGALDAGPLARAAVADAVARARACAPADVAPARRPRALPALGGAALALASVVAWPARAPAARREEPAVTSATDEPRLRVAAEALDAERAELVAAATAAEAAGDVSLAALAREGRAALDALADGTLGRGEALDRLTALAARAREAADDAETQRNALRAAGKALESDAATRALGQALGAGEPEAAARALDELAPHATSSERTRAAVASAMSAAAGSVGGDASAGAPGEKQRRLNRDAPANGASGGASASADASRHLEHLRRDLEDTAAACRGDAAACASRLREGAGGLPGEARQASETPARRRLESAVDQLRERLRRGDLERPGGGASERRFARVARGDGRPGQTNPGTSSGAPGAKEAAGESGQDVFIESPEGESPEGAAEEAPEGAGESGGTESGASAATAAAPGQGAGREAGGEPLGHGGALSATRGHEQEVRVRDGAGPTRSEIIEASAHRGFAARDYVRVFGDYAPVVEESLAEGAVPEGRRYVVRRYFQLIRPRAAGDR